MSANNFKQQQPSSFETGMPIASEYYTYYPACYNGAKPTMPTMTTTPSMPTLKKSYSNLIEQQQCQYQQQEQIKNCLRSVEDIVISGCSGKFPESSNVEEFAENLYNGVDMVTEQERRWPNGLFGLPTRNGTIKDITRFDAQFFGIHPKQVDNMDPQLRMLLEVTYEAIVDSGMNPSELKGTRTGVFIGASGSEVNQSFSADPETLSGYSMTGCATSMLANRLSYFFDFKGPSYVVDTACSSSLVAMDNAITAIKTGQCDYAIVGGVNLLVRPQTSLQFQRLGMLSAEGKCKSFDSQGKGYVRSETVGVVFIQKKTTSRRVYCKVLHSKINTDGNKEQGITFPSGEIQSRLLKEIYAESDIDPCLVTYVEAHGTGTKAGDPQELNSIADMFASPRLQRTMPLFIGSTKSNMGHPEPASGIAALVKMLISMQRGVIPANLHYKEPNQEVSALVDGRLKVVNANTKFYGGLMALNSFGFGGANAHIVLQPNNEYIMGRMGSASLWNQDLTEMERQPRLFQWCSRTQEGLETIFSHMHKKGSLAEQCLLQAQTTCTPATHPFRGYTILNSEQPEPIVEMSECPATVEKRPIWYIFSGMGTQWQGMGQDLMKIDCFRQSIMRSAETLKPFGVQLMDIICAKTNVYERTLNAFVGIAAIQVALVDCLRQAGIEADGILGHSVGELGCAYADNCFTAEQTVLAAYYRGKCIEEAQLPAGAMAAVGLTWQECQRRCPSGVVPACHNSRDTVTISGPKRTVCDFVEQLKSEGVFAKEVDSSNVAFHSYYMTAIAPVLKQALDKVIRAPKQRSSKWISSSIPEQRWETDLAKYSSPDYHVNNLCSPVLFQEALKHIPANAVCVEIAPHALLQAILKRSLPTETVHIALQKKDAKSSLEHFWCQLGRMYTEGGINVDTIRLVVPVGRENTIFPVPHTTGFVSHLVCWDHEQQWQIPKYHDYLQSQQDSTYKYVVDRELAMQDAYLSGHQIDGRIIYPATGYMHLAWTTLAKQNGIKSIEECPVVFENVEIHRATILGTKGQTQPAKKITFSVSIMQQTGLFEITESGSVVATGKIYRPEEPLAIKQQPLYNWTGRQQTDLMEQEEIYKELRLRGYEYTTEFQPIVKADIDGTRGELLWTGKWIPFLDAMLQLNVLGQKRGLLLPTRIRCIRIDPQFHAQMQSPITNEHYQSLNKYWQKSIQMNQPEIFAQMNTVYPVQYRMMDKDLMNANPTELAQWSVYGVTYDPYCNKTVCGGVEISGLHATSAPRRQLVQPTILERVNFVPYVEKQFDEEYTCVEKCTCVPMNGTCQMTKQEECLICDSASSAETGMNQQFLEYYLSECKRYINHIVNKIESGNTMMPIIQPQQAPRQWEKEFERMNLGSVQRFDYLEGGKLLQLLGKVANMICEEPGQYFYNVQKTFSEGCAYWRALETDSVLNYLNKRSTYLKSFLDTVLENTQTSQFKQNKLRILEISPSLGQFFGAKMSQFIQTHPQLSSVDYHYVPVQASGEYKDALYEMTKQCPFPIKKVDWTNICLSEPPKDLNNYDLVIFNGSLSALTPKFESEYESKEWMKTVVEKLLKPSGFMLVHEFTNNFETLQCLNYLEQLVFKQIQPKTMNTITNTQYKQQQKYQTESQWRKLIESAGFNPVALKSDTALSTMFLYRLPTIYKMMTPTGLYEDKIFIDDMDKYDWIEKVKSGLVDKQLERVWLISEKSPNSGIVGLVNCLRKEIGGEKIRCIFIADKQPSMQYGSYLVPSAEKTITTITTGANYMPKPVQWTQLFDQLRRADLVMNVFRNGQWGSYRHVFDIKDATYFAEEEQRQCVQDLCSPRDSSAQLRNAYINLISRGDLSTLKWMQSPEPCVNDTQKQVVCQVSHAALNFRDIMLATGKLTPEAIPGYYKMQDGLLGMEFSGYIQDNRQKRCMGMLPAKGLATTVVCDTKYTWEVPVDWTLRQAATVPVAYSTAYYALVVRGNLKHGETVLIHAGSGAVGQAAIAIALSYQCKVFVTVSTDEKRDYLKALYPQLSDECFANSRDIYFEQHIMQMTRGYGVDVCLNSLAEDKLQASVRVLAQHGRFLEIGKFDLNKNSALGMNVFLKNISFHGILVDSLFDTENSDWLLVHKLVTEGIKSGVVRPLHSTVFEKDQIEEAFRYMAQGKHIGKVLVCVWEPKEMNEQPTCTTGMPRVWFSPKQTYIITGGLGGFGLELTQWMVERGARNLILTSRSGIRTGYQAKKIRTLQEEFGACVRIAPHNVKDESECLVLIKEATQMSPEGKIGGIFHLAAVLEDCLVENQTADKFRSVCEVKYKGAYNLDTFSRMEGCMDDQAYFVVFSSVTSGRGNWGQTNYGFANSAMERICEYRRREGKHALAIQWGAIADVGLIVESAFGGDNDSVVGGTVPQRIQSCLKTLEILLLKSQGPKETAIWSSFVPAERQFAQETTQQTQCAKKSIVEVVGNILGVKDVKQIREQITLGELGLDSLMNVEIKQILEQNYNTSLNMKEIQQLTIEKLRRIELADQSCIDQYSPEKTITTEYLAKKVNYLMPTMTIEKLNNVELLAQQIPVYVIHPIEGHTNMLKTWAKHMKYPVYGVNFTKEAMQCESIERLAEHYWQQIEMEAMKYSPMQQCRVHLCGYSFGASVAFEMALKRNNRIASLCLLDGSHSYVTAHVATYKSKMETASDREAEATAMYLFVQQYAQIPRKQFIDELIAMPTTEQRIKYVVYHLMNNSQFQFDQVDAETATRSYLCKLQMSQKYMPQQMLRLNEVLLIKSGERTEHVRSLGEDYGLSQVCSCKVNVYDVEGDHRSFLEGNSGFQVADIVNEYLLKCF